MGSVEDSRLRYKLLTRPGILRILVILHEHGPMPVHRLPRYGIGVGTAYRSAREAALLGLARLYQCGSSTCIELTEKGRKVAFHLLEAIRAAFNGLGG
jgi:hypothetical protein